MTDDVPIKGSKTWKAWTEEENQYLRDNRSRLGAHQCAKDLDRPVSAIHNQCRRLSIKLRATPSAYKPEEDELIRELYASKGPRYLAVELNRSQETLRHRARKLKVSGRVGRPNKRSD
ncbi:Uncharacterised protein [Pseudomonas luteola]|uniref:Uncharacterized protein n=1 Tax=Pseudomonas luteola TaxID=47886 RepID=A0A2X2EF25_PSELU|nr:Uncharacterised protein [Pseudomonas luteola]